MQDLKDANRRAADIVAPAAKAKAPRRTGRLAASVRAGATQKAGVVRAGRKSVPYAGPINYGWPKRHIKATLFINKAAKATEPQWTEAYRAAVERIIQDIYSQTQGAAQ
nr:HK97 gp10 family phage protein [Bifidobacterium breve]